MYLMATTTAGEKYVSQFLRLKKAGLYAAQVMFGAKAFNVWKVTNAVHHESGQAVFYRERLLLNGKFIVSIQEVEPRVEDHQDRPENFQTVRHLEGPRGVWLAPDNEDCPEGAIRGVEYPLFRDTTTAEDYAILRVATADSPELRHYPARSQFQPTVAEEAEGGWVPEADTE